MPKEVYRTWLPVFPGFYETGYMDDDQIDQDMKTSLEGDADDADLPFDLVNYIAIQYDMCPMVRYGEWKRAIAHSCCDWVQDQLRHIFDDKDIKVIFEEITSPREYNFQNDSINCAIEIDLNKVMDYIKEDTEMFKKYLEEHYTSYDGFRSFYSNELEDWIDPVQWRKEGHQVGAVLDFVIQDWFIRNHDEADVSMLYYVTDFTPNEYMDGDGTLPDILASDFIKELAQEYMDEYEKTQAYLESHYRTDNLNYMQRQELKRLAGEWLDWAFSGISNQEALEDICNSGTTFDEYLRKIA